MFTIRKVLAWHGPLAGFGLAMAALVPVLCVAWLVDDRAVLGEPVWVKPLKFAVSFVAYALTLAWMLDRLPRRGRVHRVAWWAGTVAALASAVEMVIIAGQAARGRRSHFNVATSFDATLFSVMGATVAVLYLATVVVGVLLLRTRLGDAADAWALRLGVGVSLLGMTVGVVMVAHSGHAVGVPDGGPGLALTGWSTTGGDLRIGHFVGLHALQVLPLVAGLLAARPGAGAARAAARAAARLRLVLVTAGAYAGLVVLLTWQALRGRPLLAPDAPVLAGAALLALATAAAVALAVRPGRAPRPGAGLATA